MLFAPYGEILEINMKKAYKMKGQAFVVFKDLNQASEAMRRLQRYKLFGKELNIQYAKAKSDAIAKREGKFNPKKRAKPAGPGKVEPEDGKGKEIKEEAPAVSVPSNPRPRPRKSRITYCRSPSCR